MSDRPAAEQHHASAVSVAGRGLLIVGAPGVGKTTLALEMVALGAMLIADDRVIISTHQDRELVLSAPGNIAGLAEVRGFGLVQFAHADEVPLRLIADLDRAESQRLPPPRTVAPSGIACRVILCKGRPGLAALLTCLMRADKWLGPDHFAGP